MEERTLGKSGLKVSLVGVGCNNFGARIDLEATKKVVHKAIDLGITLFDTADIYGERNGARGFSEVDLGTALGPRRKDIVLATKFGKPMTETKQGGSRRYVMAAVEASLQRLKTDWIDLYQMHDPDPETPIEETMRALDDLITQGKVRYVGASNFAAWQLVDAQWTARHHGFSPFVSSQDEYSLLARELEDEMIPAIQASNAGLLPFFPLASGLLTGKYKKGKPAPEGTRFAREARLSKRFMTTDNIDIVEKLDAFAQARGKTLLELAFSWLASRPAVSSVIAGATKPEQLEQNVKAVGWKLTAADQAEIDTITLG